MTANQRFHTNCTKNTNQGLSLIMRHLSLITKALLRNHTKSMLVEHITQHHNSISTKNACSWKYWSSGHLHKIVVMEPWLKIVKLNYAFSTKFVFGCSSRSVHIEGCFLLMHLFTFTLVDYLPQCPLFKYHMWQLCVLVNL